MRGDARPLRRDSRGAAGGVTLLNGPADPSPTGRILVIKHGALGDIVLATGPFAAIRHHHPDAEIMLLTTRPYGEWLGGSGFFDLVWVDERPAPWDLLGWLALRRWLIQGGFDRVYDLQTSSRSSRYFQLLPRRARPQWSGIARGCLPRAPT